MTNKTDKLKAEIVNKIVNYVKQNGTKLTDDFYYWNTYPIVIKDICVSYVVSDHDELKFGDFPSIYEDGVYVGQDTDIDKFNCRMSMDKISSLKADREYLNNTFSAMKIMDSKNYKKEWQS